MSEEIKAGDLVWAFDYPTDPPYNVCNACLLEYVKPVNKEHELKRTDNGVTVYFRFVAPQETKS